MQPRKLLASLGAAVASARVATAQSGSAWRMPDEGDQHKRTWMAFAWNETVWSRELLPVTQQNLADVARAIGRFEPVCMLVRKQEMGTAQDLLAGATNVTLVEGKFDDLWVRDTGPVFVHSTNGNDSVAGVDFNFNGWGNKQGHANDSIVAEQVTSAVGVPIERTELVLEGGALEVDGNGTAIITESCVLNANRNPGWSKEQVEAELGRLLGITKVIWLPGIVGKDITDGHTDFYARFASSGQVVAGYDADPESYDHNVTLAHLDILRNASDAAGRPINVTVMTGPTTVRREYRDDEDFAAGYINFYLCNGGVLAPQFGDSKADADAYNTLTALFPDREVVQVNIDGIAAGGGGIHCATQQEIMHAGSDTINGTTTTPAAEGAASSSAASKGKRGRRTRWFKGAAAAAVAIVAAV